MPGDASTRDADAAALRRRYRSPPPPSPSMRAHAGGAGQQHRARDASDGEQPTALGQGQKLKRAKSISALANIFEPEVERAGAPDASLSAHRSDRNAATTSGRPRDEQQQRSSRQDHRPRADDAYAHASAATVQGHVKRSPSAHDLARLQHADLYVDEQPYAGDRYAHARAAAPAAGVDWPDHERGGGKQDRYDQYAAEHAARHAPPQPQQQQQQQSREHADASFMAGFAGMHITSRHAAHGGAARPPEPEYRKDPRDAAAHYVDPPHRAATAASTSPSAAYATLGSVDASGAPSFLDARGARAATGATDQFGLASFALGTSLYSGSVRGASPNSSMRSRPPTAVYGAAGGHGTGSSAAWAYLAALGGGGGGAGGGQAQNAGLDDVWQAIVAVQGDVLDAPPGVGGGGGGGDDDSVLASGDMLASSYTVSVVHETLFRADDPHATPAACFADLARHCARLVKLQDQIAALISWSSAKGRLPTHSASGGYPYPPPTSDVTPFALERLADRLVAVLNEVAYATRPRGAARVRYLRADLAGDKPFAVFGMFAKLAEKVAEHQVDALVGRLPFSAGEWVALRNAAVSMTERVRCAGEIHL